MNDARIREHFHRKVLKRYHLTPGVLVVDELGLKHGKCRADIAVINGRLDGYEIKSDEDTLDRLEQQIGIYSAVFDRVTIVTGAKHATLIESSVPQWWGIIVSHQHAKKNVRFEKVRRPRPNEQVDPYSVAQLLWSEEAASILSEMGEPKSLLRRRRSMLYERLAERLSLAELRRRVTACLKSRKTWRSPAPRIPGDDLSPPTAK